MAQDEHFPKPDPAAGAGSVERPDRERITEAFMAILAERPIEEIGFAAIGGRAGVPLHRCRAAFDSVLSVLSAKLREIDTQVLEGLEAEMADEPPRELLFDILMRRFEALTPYKAAIRSLVRSARSDPGLALALNGFAVRSQHWMLTAADISSSGLRGSIRAQGLACLYANAMRVWLEDDDPGLARTMAALDRELNRGARWSRFLDDVARMVPRPGRFRSRWRSRAEAYEDRRPHRGEDPGEQPAVV